MLKLNLTAAENEKEKVLVKEYLENNASDTLADKINNGVRVVKDGLQLVSKKDLTGFMKYACEEARKLADKGARSACVEDQAVFGWAIHYFEEDSIEGTLYNVDGTAYEKPKPEYKPAPVQAPVVKPPKMQMSLFDLGDQTASGDTQPAAAEAAPAEEEPGIDANGDPDEEPDENDEDDPGDIDDSDWDTLADDGADAENEGVIA